MTRFILAAGLLAIATGCASSEPSADGYEGRMRQKLGEKKYGAYKAEWKYREELRDKEAAW